MSEELIKDLFTYGATFVCGCLTGRIANRIVSIATKKDGEVE